MAKYKKKIRLDIICKYICEYLLTQRVLGRVKAKHLVTKGKLPLKTSSVFVSIPSCGNKSKHIANSDNIKIK